MLQNIIGYLATSSDIVSLYNEVSLSFVFIIQFVETEIAAVF